MFVIQNCIISDLVKEVKFCCNLKYCKGICCVEGDEGAPLEPAEVELIEEQIDEIYPFMTDSGIKTIKEKGFFEFGAEGDFVTPLINECDCAYICYEGPIAMCAIEKAYKAGKINFNKPISCHLYPIRLRQFDDSIAINYDRWHICDKALKEGGDKGIMLYKFLKEPLIRRFGVDWYNEFVEYIETEKNK